MSGLKEIGLREPSLSLEGLAGAVHLDRSEVRRRIERGRFRPRLVRQGRSGEFTLEDAVVLLAASRLIEMDMTAEAALTHADAARGWKPDRCLVVAPEHLAVRFGTENFSSHHAASKTYGGVMTTKDINSWIEPIAQARMTNFDGLVIGSLDRLEDELRITLGDAESASESEVSPGSAEKRA